jgi:hypothetical protein
MCRIDTYSTNYSAWWGFLSSSDIDESWFGFRVVNGDLYCHSACGGAVYNFAVPSIDVTQDHIYRVQYVAGEKKLYWYIDGVLITTLQLTDDDYFGTDEGPEFGLKINDDVSDGSLLIGNLTIGRQI